MRWADPFGIPTWPPSCNTESMELTTVGPTFARFHRVGETELLDDLVPGSNYDYFGHEFTTLRQRGELLCSFATVNDVHFGETQCGVIEGSDAGPVLSSLPGMGPYPTLMSEAAAEEIAATDPAAVLVKGDLTASGTVGEYAQFLDCYGRFGDRLHHVRGNHDSYHEAPFARDLTCRVDLPGAIIAMIDTSRDRQVNGSVSADQLAWLEDLAATADRPVMVFGHHHMWLEAHDVDRDDYFGIRPRDAEALRAVFDRHSSFIGYFAGHTHRNRVVYGGERQLPFVEVAAVKDFPGSWAQYLVFEGNVLQVHHRISRPDALRWSDECRRLYDGGYPWYAFGSLADRCFEVWAS